MKCKHCGNVVHYCSSCDPDPDLDFGCCSTKCREVHYDWFGFKSFWYRLYNFTLLDDNERKILLDCKHELWNEWCWRKDSNEKSKV